MALTPERRAQMDAALRGGQATGKLTPERRAQMDAVLAGSAPAAPVQRQPGFLASLAAPFTKTLATGLGAIEGIGTLAGEALKPGKITPEGLRAAEAAATRERDFGVFGKATPIGADISATEGVGSALGKFAKPVIGTGLELGSYAAPVGVAAKTAQAAKFLPKAVQAVKSGAQFGALGGALGGGGRELATEGSTLGSTLGQAAIGGALGGVVGGALPAVGVAANVVGKGLGVTKRIGEKAIERGRLAIAPGTLSDDAVKAGRFETVRGLTNNYQKLGKIVEKNKRYGVDVEKLVADTDVLVGAVDEEGKILTQNAVSQIDNIEKPYKDAVRRLLEREGSSVDAGQFSSFVRQRLSQSGILGADLQRAMATAEREIRALLKKYPDGRIPLTAIHDLKVYKGGTKAAKFLNPSQYQADTELYSALRQFVEDNSSEPVKAINKELQTFEAVKEYLEAMHGRKVMGGRLGKYFAQTTGAVLGGQFGGIPGGIVGAEAAAQIQSRLMRGTFGRATGKAMDVADILKWAEQKAGSPRLALPPGKPGGPQVGSGPAIPLMGPSVIETRARTVGTTDTGAQAARPLIPSAPQRFFESRMPTQMALPPGQPGASGPVIPMRGATTFEAPAQKIRMTRTGLGMKRDGRLRKLRDGKK